MAGKLSTDLTRHFRFADVANEPRRRLPPIQGFEKKPTVSLEEAVVPVKSLVPQVQQMVWTVKGNDPASLEGLTEDESASIRLYTMEWTPKERSFYYVLNEALRSVDREKLKPWFLYLKLIVSAFAHLPSIGHTSIVFRGVKLDLRAEYPKGSTFIWWGFTSCTEAIDVLERDEYCGKVGSRTLFNIECHSGRHIQRHSFYPDENEVLLLPGRQFQVVGCGDMGNGLHLVHLKEIDTPFPMISTIDPRPRQSLPTSTSKLSFMGKKLTDADMPRVINEWLSLKECCNELDLSYNGFKHAGAAILAEALKKNQASEVTEVIFTFDEQHLPSTVLDTDDT